MLNDLSLHPDENIVSLLEELRKNEFNFVLTGSTYFDGIGNDFDFMVVNDKIIGGYLEQLNFIDKTAESEYRDGSDESIVAVFEHRILPVHVQIIKNEDFLRAKSAIQVVCKGNMQIEELLGKKTIKSRLFRKEVWKTLMALYLMGEKKASL